VQRFQKRGRGRAQSLDFRAIYDRWFDEVSHWILALGGLDSHREDLVQDVFLVVCRRLPDFEGNNLAGWLYQITRRRVRDFLRLAWVKHSIGGNASLIEDLAESGVSPAEALETKEKRELLESLLSNLSDSERAALVSFELDGLSGEQIATEEGVTVSTIWARIHKARKKLKVWRDQYERKVGFPT